MATNYLEKKKNKHNTHSAVIGARKRKVVWGRGTDDDVSWLIKLSAPCHPGETCICGITAHALTPRWNASCVKLAWQSEMWGVPQAGSWRRNGRHVSCFVIWGWQNKKLVHLYSYCTGMSTKFPTCFPSCYWSLIFYYVFSFYFLLMFFATMKYGKQNKPPTCMDETAKENSTTLMLLACHISS